jgi:alcohol dehydrogenase class IV
MYALSRLRVAATARVLPWLNIPVPLTFIGADASLSLVRSIGGSGVRRLMLVSDRPLLALGLAEPMLALLKSEGVEVDIFDDVVPDPDDVLVMKGVERLRDSKAEALLAIGGGSSIDCAKAINLCHANRCKPAALEGLWLYARPRRRGLPFYAVPTTAGTGSEVTIAAVVSDREAQIKRSIIDPKMVPGTVALDPKLTTGLPPHITAATGMDALTHAVEAYLSVLANEQTDAWALAAVKLIARHLRTAYAQGKDLAAREGMLVGSCQAGLAFTRAGVGYVHAVAHQLGALYHLPHGLANAIVLPYVLEFSRPACVARMADLARAAGAQSGSHDDDQLSKDFIDWVRSLNAQMKIPTKADALRPADMDRIVNQAFAEAHGTYGIPRYLDRRQALALLNELAPN